MRAFPVAILLLGAVFSAGQVANPRPAVIPTVREWTGALGYLSCPKHPRIVLIGAQISQLSKLARTLQQDLRDSVGIYADIAANTNPEGGDIVFVLDSSLKSLPDEGYKLLINQHVELRAATEIGLFYATRSLLQLIRLDKNLPRGEITDWPDYSERGFMLDVGRKFFDIKYLRQYVKFMAWYKLNDFQLHLNDDADDDYSGFRLNSPKFPGLANVDGAYTRKQINDLEKLAARYHVNITPEIDAPAHARALIKYRPDLGSPKLPKNHLDLKNPQTQPFINSIWKEFIPWFTSPWVHIGADEYNGGPGRATYYKAYINATAAFIRSQGKQVRMWGGLKTAGDSKGVDRDIVINLWYPGYHDPIEAVNDGYKIINTHDGYLYIVPFAGYYFQFLDTRSLYNSWVPTTFDNEKLPAHDPRVLGGMFAVWNDKGAYPYTFADVHELVKPAMPTLGELLWSGHAEAARSYDQFAQDALKLDDGPGVRVAKPLVAHAPGDLAFQKAAKASESPDGDFGVQTLFDGRAPTRWIADAKKPQWVSVDLGSEEATSRVVLRWVPHGYASTYRISTSVDGVNWNPAYQTSSGKGSTESVSFLQRKARFVKLELLRFGGTTGQYSLFAIEVYK